MSLNVNDMPQQRLGIKPEDYTMMDLPGRHDRTAGSTWFYIFILSLMLHAVLILFLLILQPFNARDFEAAHPEPIQLVFAERIDPRGNDPSTFTELPEDRKDESPDSPDFLSNVDSRARDDVDGGIEDAMPRLTGESEAPHVRMDPDIPGTIPVPNPDEKTESPMIESSTSPARPENPEEMPQELPRATPAPHSAYGARRIDEPNEDDRHSEPIVSETHDAAIPPVGNDSPAEPPPKANPPLSGTADLFQEAMKFHGGNTALSGIVSMNTTAWAYAPWLQRFRRDLMRSWLAPVAYYMGIIHGYTTVELEIARDGELLRLDVIEEEGHVSLHETSISLFKILAPYHPLPPDFPEKSLILSVKLVYPSRR